MSSPAMVTTSSAACGLLHMSAITVVVICDYSRGQLNMWMHHYATEEDFYEKIKAEMCCTLIEVVFG
jgi:hypothetical protein